MNDVRVPISQAQSHYPSLDEARGVARSSADPVAAQTIGWLVARVEAMERQGCGDFAHVALGEAVNRAQNEVSSMRRQLDSEYERGFADGKRDVKVRIELVDEEERGALERAEAELAEVRRELAQFGRQLDDYERREREDR